MSKLHFVFPYPVIYILLVFAGAKGGLLMGKHMTLDERISIQTGLKENLSYAEIASLLGKSKSTISREVQKHRLFVPHNKTATLQTHNVCLFRSDCNIKQKCNSPTCYRQRHQNCRLCGGCNAYCSEFQEEICDGYKHSPFVCNGCSKKPRCPLSKWIYDAKEAQAAYEHQRSESRQGIALTERELVQLDQLISPLLKNGQSVRHICRTNSAEIPVSDRTIYKYIRSKYLSVDLFDLRRTVQRKGRNKPGPSLLIDKKCRQDRLYSDFSAYLKQNPDVNVVEADTVEGVKGGKVLLTLFFRNCNLQLAFLRERNTSASVSSVFHHLRTILTPEEFSMLFPVILTDRGSEFTDPLAMEIDPETGELQSRIFYCDPQNSNQKSGCERNHEFIRYFLPKGSSFDNLTQENVDLMMCHINSYGRSEYNYKTPADLFQLIYGETITKKLGIRLISPQNIILMPTLIK